MAKPESSRARIREVRKDQGMTLQELADKVGTTAQSVQRLETGKTKLNLDWLDRFAAALEVPMNKLIGTDKSVTIALVGSMGASGTSAPLLEGDEKFELAIPARDPVAVRMSQTVGPYRQGSVLIADRCAAGTEAQADGRSCLVALADGTLLLRRAVVHSNQLVTLLAHGGHGEVLHGVPYRWLAPIVMVVSYI